MRAVADRLAPARCQRIWAWRRRSRRLSTLERVHGVHVPRMKRLIGQGAAVTGAPTTLPLKPLAGAARRVPGIFGSVVGGIHDHRGTGRRLA